jgi:SAM-dependent methyltransferase
MASTEACVEYAPWNEWQAKDYLTEYYAEVMPDEQYALAFLQESVARLPEVEVALDYGCGPTVHHAVALVPKAKQIHLAEYLPGNLAEIQKWLDASQDAHDWKTFTRYILQLEGNDSPSESDILEREQESRRRIVKLSTSDAGDDDPLGTDMRGFFPLVTTHYCAEGATNCKETWAKYMRNIASLVRPGGTLILSACGAADFYMVGDRLFPCAGVNAIDVLGCLQKNGFAEIDLRVRCVPDHSDQGYSSVIFACAKKLEG